MLLRRYHNIIKEIKVENIKQEKPTQEKVNLSNLKVVELRQIAKDEGLEDYTSLKKNELIEAIEGVKNGI